MEEYEIGINKYVILCPLCWMKFQVYSADKLDGIGKSYNERIVTDNIYREFFKHLKNIHKIDTMEDLLEMDE